MNIELSSCPCCYGTVKYFAGYYSDGNWRWPAIACQTRNCGLTYQPVIYPDNGEIFTNWNRRSARERQL